MKGLIESCVRLGFIQGDFDREALLPEFQKMNNAFLIDVNSQHKFSERQKKF